MVLGRNFQYVWYLVLLLGQQLNFGLVPKFGAWLENGVEDFFVLFLQELRLKYLSHSMPYSISRKDHDLNLYYQGATDPNQKGVYPL